MLLFLFLRLLLAGAGRYLTEALGEIVSIGYE